MPRSFQLPSGSRTLGRGCPNAGFQRSRLLSEQTGRADPQKAGKEQCSHSSRDIHHRFGFPWDSFEMLWFKNLTLHCLLQLPDAHFHTICILGTASVHRRKRKETLRWVSCAPDSKGKPGRDRPGSRPRPVTALGSLYNVINGSALGEPPYYRGSLKGRHAHC